jgi:hypothetical protein
VKKGGYWEDKENRRKLLIDYAADMGFDPLKLDNWKRVSIVRLNQYITQKVKDKSKTITK